MSGFPLVAMVAMASLLVAVVAGSGVTQFCNELASATERTCQHFSNHLCMGVREEYNKKCSDSDTAFPGKHSAIFGDSLATVTNPPSAQSVTHVTSPQCYIDGQSYSGGNVSATTNETSAEACQSRCQLEPACTSFSFKTCWSPRLEGNNIREQHTNTTQHECYDFDTAKAQCEEATDCHGIATQKSKCDGQYRVTHGTTATLGYYGNWPRAKMWAYTVDRTCLSTVGLGTCTLHNSSASMVGAASSVVGPAMRTSNAPGAPARCQQVKCGAEPGTLLCPPTSTQCFDSGGFEQDKATCLASWGGTVLCPDGDISFTGVAMYKEWASGPLAVCFAWNSPEAARGFQMCTADASICTKAKVGKAHMQSKSSGIFMMKRINCEGDNCYVHKVGKCFDVGQDVFSHVSTDSNSVDAATLEQESTEFATLVMQGLEDGTAMQCSDTPYSTQYSSHIDTVLATAMIKGF